MKKKRQVPLSAVLEFATFDVSIKTYPDMEDSRKDMIRIKHR
jgi:hypothetical protein